MTRPPQTAMVLAAGLGTRMRPLTDVCPKPLIEVAGKPLIAYTLDRFAAAGVTRAIVNVHYRADQMEAWLAGYRDLEIVISDERAQLMETGGGLVQAAPLLGDAPFFCANTDAILIDEGEAEACAALAAAWDPARMDALLLLVPKTAASGLDGRGDFEIDHEGRLDWRRGDSAPFFFTGLQIIAPSLIRGARQAPFSTKRFWQSAMENGRLVGLVHRGRWMHVGDPDGLLAAERYFADHPDEKRASCGA